MFALRYYRYALYNLGNAQASSRYNPTLTARPKGTDMGEYFSNWNYRKHAKLCAGVYLALFAIDMTVGYVLAKKLLDK